MSYGVHFLGFHDDGNGAARMREVLRPHANSGGDEITGVTYGDGSAEIDLHDDGMMATHVDGNDTWDLLVAGAQAADWVVLPQDAPLCIVDEAQRSDLPEDMVEDFGVELVSSGAELLRVIEAC